MKQLLSITSLVASYDREALSRSVVDNVSLTVTTNACRGLIGETGSGKTTLMLAALQLLPYFGGIVHSGTVMLEDTHLSACHQHTLQQLWGNTLGFYAQDSEVTFDPSRSVLDFVSEPLRSHARMSAGARAQRVRALVSELGGSDLLDRLAGPSASLATSMRQLLGLVAAMICEPRLLVLDDPTSSLDALSRSLVVDALRSRLRDGRTGIWLATHDLTLVQDLACHVDVLYGGQVVESASTAAFLEDALHPYSIGLLASASGVTSDPASAGRLPVITPNATPELSTGCRFRQRCAFYSHGTESIVQRCQTESPALREVRPGHFSRCHFAEMVLA